MFGLAPLDLLMIALYFLIVLFIGFWAARRVKTEKDYFIGGRRFSGPLLIAHWLCTGTHSETPVQLAGATYQVGLSGIWYQWNWLFATPFYWLIAPITRRLRIVTTGDFFRQRFGRGLELVYTLIALVFYVCFIGMVFQGTGKAIAAATGMELRLGHTIVILSAVSAFYVFFGGIVAAALTDLLQGFLLVVLSLLLVPFGLRQIGGMAALHDHLPAEMFRIVTEGVGEGSLMFAVMLAVISLVGIIAQPHTVVATGSGKTEWEARVGMTYGNFVKRFLTIAWAFTGLIGFVLFEGLEYQTREEVWGLSIQALLPVGFRGLMIAAMMAGITAVETFMVVGSGLFTRNFYEPLFTGRSETHYLLVGRIAALGVLAMGIVVALTAPTITDIYKFSLQVISLVGIPMWLGVFWRRTTPAGAWAGLLAAVAAWLVGFGLKWATPLQALLYLPGGFLAGIVVSLLTRPLPDEAMDRFYARLHTPVSRQEVEEGRDAQPEAAENPPLTRALGLEIPRPDRADVIGFLLAWALVGILVGLLWFLARLGA